MPVLMTKARLTAALAGTKCSAFVKMVAPIIPTSAGCREAANYYENLAHAWNPESIQRGVRTPSIRQGRAATRRFERIFFSVS